MVLQGLKQCLGRRSVSPASTELRPVLCDRCKQPLRTHDQDVENKATKRITTRKVGNDKESEDEDGRELRKLWALYEAIPDESFCSLVNKHMEKHGSQTDFVFHIENRTHGSSNYIVILSNGTTKLVVKIPANGHPPLWNPAQAQIMRSEAHTLMYIKHKLPNFPCPTILARDETFDNAIGAPYLMMTFLEGQQSAHIWLQTDEDGKCDDYINNNVSAEKENLRAKFLTSLAQTMAELRHLEFDSIGMLYLENEEDPSTCYIGPHYHFLEVSATSRRYLERPVFTAAEAYYKARHELFNSTPASGRDFMRAMILSSPPFSSSKKDLSDTNETFGLAHDDLAFQNILVSPEGKVTGILDWNGITTLPLPVAFSAVPSFLQEDWRLGYAFPSSSRLFPWNLVRYRSIYASAFKAACGEDTEAARYTAQSALYKAVQNMLYGDFGNWMEKEEALLKKIMLEIPSLRSVDFDTFWDVVCEEEFRRDWKEVREIWRREVPRILNPEAV